MNEIEDWSVCCQVRHSGSPVAFDRYLGFAVSFLNLPFLLTILP
jgi:hypothetical protein